MGLANKLVFQDGTACVIRNQFLSVFLKWLSILVVLICGLFVYMMVTKLSGWWRFLSIPFAAIFAIYYVFGYAKVGRNTSDVILEITPSVLIQPEVNVQIPLNSIISITDQSFYYDFEGSGPSNKGWHHVIEIEYLEEAEKETTHLTGLGLTHEDHLRVVNYLNGMCRLHRNN